MNAAVVSRLLLLLSAQAQPPPPEANPAPAPAPPVAAAEPAGANGVSVFIGPSFRISPGGEQLTPTVGFSVGGLYERRYLRLGPPEAPTLFLGASANFFHDHFTLALEGPSTDYRTLTQTGFSIAQTVALPLQAITLWASVGVGFTFGYFSTPELTLRPGTASSRQPFVCGGLGVDWAIKAGMGVRVRFNFTQTLNRPDFVTETGDHLNLFGDLFDSGIGLFYRF
ncbi:MAG TPA: hypothetical protein VGL59_13245 [Polyangia bacterium]|jgi:hypothetical protein